MPVSPEILAAQQAYAARPFATRIKTRTFSGTSRFDTFNEALEYAGHSMDCHRKDIERFGYANQYNDCRIEIVLRDGAKLPWEIVGGLLNWDGTVYAI